MRRGRLMVSAAIGGGFGAGAGAFVSPAYAGALAGLCAFLGVLGYVMGEHL